MVVVVQEGGTGLEKISNLKSGKSPNMDNRYKKEIVSILVNDDKRALFEITKIFTLHGISIDSITVGKAQKDSGIDTNIIIEYKHNESKEFLKHIFNIDQVTKVIPIDEKEFVGGELMLIKVGAAVSDRPIIHKISLTYNATIIDIDQKSMTIKAFGSTDELDELSNHLKKQKVLESFRTGYIALKKEKRLIG